MTKKQTGGPPPWRVAFFEVGRINFTGHRLGDQFADTLGWEDWTRIWKGALALEKEKVNNKPHFLLHPSPAPWNQIFPESQLMPRYVELGERGEKLFPALGDELIQESDIPDICPFLPGRHREGEEPAVVTGVFFEESPLNGFSIEKVLDILPAPKSKDHWLPPGEDGKQWEVQGQGEGRLLVRGVSGCTIRMRISPSACATHEPGVEAEVTPPPSVSAPPYFALWSGADALYTAVRELAPFLAGEEGEARAKQAMGEIGRFAKRLGMQYESRAAGMKLWGRAPTDQLSGIPSSLPLAAAVGKTLKRACVSAALMHPEIKALGNVAFGDAVFVGSGNEGAGEGYMSIWGEHVQRGEVLMGELLSSGAMDNVPWELPVESKCSLYAYCWNMFGDAMERHVPHPGETEGREKDLVKGLFTLYMHGWGEGSETGFWSKGIHDVLSMKRAVLHATRVLRTFCDPSSPGGGVAVEDAIGQEWAGVLGTCAVRLPLLRRQDLGLNAPARDGVSSVWLIPHRGGRESESWHPLLFLPSPMSGSCQSQWFPGLAGSAEEFLCALESALEGAEQKRNLAWADSMFRSLTYDGISGIDYSVAHYPYLAEDTFQRAQEEAERIKSIRDRIFLKVVSAEEDRECERSGEIMF